MKKNFLLFIGLFLILLSCSEEKQLEIDYFYKHFVGNIFDKDKKMQISMNLIKKKDKVFGNYFYQKDGVSIELEGKFLNNGTFLLNEKNAYFKFKFSGKKITGFWKDKTTKFSLEAEENYENSEELESFFHKEKNLNLDVFYLNSKNSKISDILLKKFFGDNFIKNKPEENLKKYAETYKKSFEGVDSNVFKTYEHSIFSEVIFNEQNILVIGNNLLDYSGGAHGSNASNYYVYDLKSNKNLKLKDVFKKNFENRLSKLLTEKLRKKLKVDSLTEASYFEDEIQAVENFFITKNGITFVYNAHEIAPYFVGETKVFLDFKNLKNILKIMIN